MFCLNLSFEHKFIFVRINIFQLKCKNNTKNDKILFSVLRLGLKDKEFGKKLEYIMERSSSPKC